MSNRLPIFILIVAVVFAVLSSSLFRITEMQRAVKLRFGELVESDIKPGLHLKVPFADDVKIMDARVLTLDARPESVYTVEKKRLEVDSFAKWRVLDVERYYKATGGDEARANQLLSNRINDNLRNQFGVRTLHDVVAGERDQMLAELTANLNQSSQLDLGVEVIDVRVKRIDFPPEVSSAVFERMRTDRKKEARQYRSEGKELAEKIRADADREQIVIEAQAYEQAEKVRGEGDAQAAAIYAAAYNQDPEFYAFFRRLGAYEKSFANKGDILLVDPDSDFFRYLNKVGGQ